MDKKKVIELIKQTISELSATDMGIICTQSTLEAALEELQKPDWISVEDGLPPYNEEVWVRVVGLGYANYVKSMRYETKNKHIILEYDKNDFEVLSRLQHVTHWHKIDKLEVWT